MTDESKIWRKLLALAALAGLAIVAYFLSPFAYRPDRPVETIAPGSSAGPAFVVQIIRPRMGLPLGGILPPDIFGLDEQLVFESTGAGASIDRVGPRRIELSGDDWSLVYALDADGRVTSETEVVFEFVFEDQPRTVRCRPGDPAIGTVSTTNLAGSGELSGSFDIELAHCEDAETEKPSVGRRNRSFCTEALTGS